MATTKFTLAERFATKYLPEPNTGCWLWIGKDWSGYGVIWGGGSRKKGKFRAAHRVSYELHIGPIPDGLELDHLCRVTCCVNPAHLEPVTHLVNLKRGNWGKFRRVAGPLPSHCKNGHELTPDNVYDRACRICRDAYMAQWRAKNRPKKNAHAPS